MTPRMRAMASWTALAALSALFVLALEAANLPAALLLGTMAAAVVFGARDAGLRVHAVPFTAAQAIVGCMIARSIQPSTLTEIAHDWPVFVLGVFSVIAAGAALGWLLMRWQVLPGTTAIWGSSPGAATAMTLMSASYGADSRLVAFMQYLRIIVVALTATLVARIWAVPVHGTGLAVVWFPPIAWPAFAATILLALVSAVAGSLLRIPAGALQLPIFVGTFLQAMGLMTIELPPWLLALAYALIGWGIGLRFTRPILRHAANALPRVLAAILCLVVISAGFAALLAVFAHIDPLTAYLATCPGGADSVAIIAASTKVDVPFIMAMQTARSVLLQFMGPAIARLLSGRARKRSTCSGPGPEEPGSF